MGIRKSDLILQIGIEFFYFITFIKYLKSNILILLKCEYFQISDGNFTFDSGLQPLLNYKLFE